jgi:hypothetical protein
VQIGGTLLVISDTLCGLHRQSPCFFPGKKFVLSVLSYFEYFSPPLALNRYDVWLRHYYFYIFYYFSVRFLYFSIQLDGGFIICESCSLHHLHHRHVAFLRGALETVAVGQEKISPNMEFGSFLELVQILILRRNCKNFIFNKANFAVECGRFGEKFNAVKNKIWQLQPRNQSLNKLLSLVFHVLHHQHDTVGAGIGYHEAIAYAFYGVGVCVRPGEYSGFQRGIKNALWRKNIEVDFYPALVVAADGHHRLFAKGNRPLAVDEITAAYFQAHVLLVLGGEVRCQYCCPGKEQKGDFYYGFSYLFTVLLFFLL